MSDLVRFGVAMDRGLLARFDARIAGRGYENRSEALRDLVRADLTRAAWDAGAVVVGTLTLLVTRKLRAEVGKLLEAAPAGLVGPSLGQPLDGERHLEVIVLRGRAGELSALAGRIAGTRGVLSAELSVAGVDEASTADDAHERGRGGA